MNFIPLFCRNILSIYSLGTPSDIESMNLYLSAKYSFTKESFDIAVPLGGLWTYYLARLISVKVVGVGQSGPERKCLRLSDVFVALTPFDEKRAKVIYPTIATTLIPNGVNVDRFRPTRSSLGGSEVILCVAALVEDKRHDLLFDAVLGLPTAVSVVCIGDGPLRQKLLRHPLALAGRVDFRVTPFNKIHFEYEAAAVFSLPSLDEAFGIVFIEAMAAGLPIVANDGPRQRFVIGENGLLCDVTNTEIYRLKLSEALKIGRSLAVRNYAVSRFSWEKISAAYSNLFISL
jgi:glycosyltransferase involved in cell wall biosynthesis